MTRKWGNQRELGYRPVFPHPASRRNDHKLFVMVCSLPHDVYYLGVRVLGAALHQRAVAKFFGVICLRGDPSVDTELCELDKVDSR